MLNAMQAIDVLALHLPNKLILPDALNFAQEAIGSPEAHVRAAACTVIVDVAEGCSDALRKKLLPVLQVKLQPYTCHFLSTEHSALFPAYWHPFNQAPGEANSLPADQAWQGFSCLWLFCCGLRI